MMRTGSRPTVGIGIIAGAALAALLALGSPPAGAGSLWEDDGVSYFTQRKASRVGDAVTVIIVEEASASNQSQLRLTKESSTRLYVSPVNASFSKYPDATFIVHPVKHGGIVEDMRYLHEQEFVGSWYPKYAVKNPEAKLDVIVSYGKPELFCGEDFRSFHDVMKYTKSLKKRIGLLESPFPTTLLFRALGDETEMPYWKLETAAKRLFDHYAGLGINMEKVSDRPGVMTPVEQLAERAIVTLNSNAAYRIFGSKTDEFITSKSGRFISLDEKLQRWYANTIRHLDP